MFIKTGPPVPVAFLAFPLLSFHCVTLVPENTRLAISAASSQRAQPESWVGCHRFDFKERVDNACENGAIVPGGPSHVSPTPPTQPGYASLPGAVPGVNVTVNIGFAKAGMVKFNAIIRDKRDIYAGVTTGAALATTAKK